MRTVTHPGRMLEIEFLEPYNMSFRELGRLIGVPANRISQLVNGKRSMSIDTAKRLEALFGTSAQFWMNLQLSHDLSVAANKTYNIKPYKPAETDNHASM